MTVIVNKKLLLAFLLIIIIVLLVFIFMISNKNNILSNPYATPTDIANSPQAKTTIVVTSDIAQYPHVQYDEAMLRGGLNSIHYFDQNSVSPAGFGMQSQLVTVQKLLLHYSDNVKPLFPAANGQPAVYPSFNNEYDPSTQTETLIHNMKKIALGCLCITLSRI